MSLPGGRWEESVLWRPVWPQRRWAGATGISIRYILIILVDGHAAADGAGWSGQVVNPVAAAGDGDPCR